MPYEEIEKAGEAGKADWVYSYGHTWGGMQNYSNLYLQMGGEWLDENEKIKVNNETSLAVVEEFKKLNDAGNIVQCSGVDQFAIFKAKEARSEEKLKGMVDFLVWLQGNQLEWVKSGANPSSLAMLENEEYLAMPQSFLLTTEEGRNAININAAVGLSYVFSEYDARSWDMITGKADIAQTMDEIQKIVDEKTK